MKTAMQELRDKLLDEGFLSEQQKIGVKPILERLIHKEKNQICEAHNSGYNNAADVLVGEATYDLNADEKYYTKTYNQ